MPTVRLKPEMHIGMRQCTKLLSALTSKSHCSTHPCVRILSFRSPTSCCLSCSTANENSIVRLSKHDRRWRNFMYSRRHGINDDRTNTGWAILGFFRCAPIGNWRRRAAICRVPMNMRNPVYLTYKDLKLTSLPAMLGEMRNREES